MQNNSLLKLSAVITLLVAVSLGSYVAYESKAHSYLSSDPKACINCHVMNTQYATWQHSSHAQTATCIECHLPTEGFFRKYMAKARDGFNHSFAFTFNTYDQAIRVSENGARRIQENCVRCHSALVSTFIQSGVTRGQSHIEIKSQRTCWSCHIDVPHGRARGLSSTPFNLGVREVK